MLQFGWYANVLMIPGLRMLAFGEPRGGVDAMFVHGLLLFLLWVDALFWFYVPGDPGPISVSARGAGYYAWMASVLIVCLGLLVLNRRGPAIDESAASIHGREGALEREPES